MKRDAALACLRPMEEELRRQGLSALFLFGSVARDDASESSDVDLLFEVSPDVRFRRASGVTSSTRRSRFRAHSRPQDRGCAKAGTEAVQVF